MRYIVCLNDYVDLEGKPVERTKEEYPYSYSPFLVWIGKYNKEKSNTVYSDRLHQWDSEKFNQCCQDIWNNTGQYFSDRSPQEIEEFLSKYFGEKVKLTVIMEECNVSSGFPYWRFCYEKLEKENITEG